MRSSSLSAIASPDSPGLVVYRYQPRLGRLRRIANAAAAALALVALSPVLVIAASAIVIDDGMPFLFTQRRVGRFGKLFTIYKLRTMKRESSFDALSPRSAGDSRITRVGGILRKTSIDELPQLVNVLRGEMALVGPRPEMPFVVKKYARWQSLRHLVTPGLTGIWQITARKTVPLELPAATVMDLEYIRTASVLLDIKLIARTILSVLNPKGAF
jgi:lipopolysaccharide/colanic/teichoic acid biosynthesis glycosyltransferase